MKRGFTLFDLMISLMMVAIIAAIGISQRNDSILRTKVASAHADMRRVATALESYATDYGKYPYDGVNAYLPASIQFSYWYLPYTISTPVAYLPTHRVPDPFRRASNPLFEQMCDMRYISTGSTWGAEFPMYTGNPTPSHFLSAVRADVGGYRVQMAGPDGTMGPQGYHSPATQPPFNYPYSSVFRPYDATNGTFSTGDMIRSEICLSGYPQP
ncbi:hypothetical protein CVU37_02765 [candidate division BRC1 bacterium HGW-BRC1-1]|jgi:type II secretory pathway pseudopilin PulG|nr:MAG: hypothetical protein CVU37_02765 [candidate division BRC1 bacterium HGW-BRC1-1]